MTDERVKNARAHMARWETKRESALNLIPVLESVLEAYEDLLAERDRLRRTERLGR